MCREKLKTPEFWISAAGLGVLTAAFIWWLFTNTETTWYSHAAALLSAAMFAVLGLGYVPRLTGFWRVDAKEAKQPWLNEKDPPYVKTKLFMLILMLDWAIIIAVYLLRRYDGYQGSFIQSLEFWRCLDSGHYLAIAKDWYLYEGDWDRLVQLVFLPGYPVLVRLMSGIVGYELYAGLLVSALCFAGSGCMLYKLLRLDFPLTILSGQ